MPPTRSVHLESLMRGEMLRLAAPKSIDDMLEIEYNKK